VITDGDFRDALKEVRPSALREVLVQVPDTSWEDIGGLESLKQELHEAIEWPLKHRKAFEYADVRPPRGVLLTAAGTGKTLIAKAVAHTTESNFISIKGPSSSQSGSASRRRACARSSGRRARPRRA